MIAAAGVTVRAGGRALIERVSVAVAPGEIVAVIGPNGAGKSTLLRVLAGERHPDEGFATLDGTKLERWPRRDLARRRAVLPQSSHVAFPVSAAEVVALGRFPHDGAASRRDDAAAVEAALAAAGVTHLAGRRFDTLSGGEQQRVHLARTLAQIWRRHDDGDARYLLLDEPTAALDLAHQQAVLTAVRRLASAGAGVLAVLHDLNLAAAFADRVVALARGRIVAEGTPDAVLTADTIGQTFGTPCEVIGLADGRRVVVAGAPPA